MDELKAREKFVGTVRVQTDVLQIGNPEQRQGILFWLKLFIYWPSSDWIRNRTVRKRYLQPILPASFAVFGGDFPRELLTVSISTASHRLVELEEFAIHGSSRLRR